MQPARDFIDKLYREEVLRARQMDPAEKLLDGPRLFDFACQFTDAGIRNQHPDANDDRVAELLVERLNVRRRFEERGIYRPIEEPR
jgi:hypothetical protein